jgi:hypothetical protein
MPHVRSEVISGKYVVQYTFAAIAMAVVEPLIGAIGVGWTFTICEFYSLSSACGCDMSDNLFQVFSLF